MVDFYLSVVVFVFECITDTIISVYCSCAFWWFALEARKGEQEPAQHLLVSTSTRVQPLLVQIDERTVVPVAMLVLNHIVVPHIEGTHTEGEHTEGTHTVDVHTVVDRIVGGCTVAAADIAKVVVAAAAEIVGQA